MKKRIRAGWAKSELGSSMVETAIFMPVLLTLLLGVVDFGRAYYEANEVAGAAHAGAVYGSQNPTDTTGMKDMVTASAADLSSTITPGASYGCECSDGTGASASCGTVPACSGTTQVYYVKVTASESYSSLIPWPKFLGSITLADSVEMRSEY